MPRSFDCASGRQVPTRARIIPNPYETIARDGPSECRLGRMKTEPCGNIRCCGRRSICGLSQIGYEGNSPHKCSSSRRDLFVQAPTSRASLRPRDRNDAASLLRRLHLIPVSGLKRCAPGLEDPRCDSADCHIHAASQWAYRAAATQWHITRPGPRYRRSAGFRCSA